MSLVRLLRLYPSEVRADMQRFYGLNIDDAPLLHVAACVAHLPEDSAVLRAMYPEHVRWGVSEYLLAVIADCLRWLVWAKTPDAKRNRNRPKPIPRPGDERRGAGRFKGAVGKSVDEVKRLLALPRK